MIKYRVTVNVYFVLRIAKRLNVNIFHYSYIALFSRKTSAHFFIFFFKNTIDSNVYK